MFILRYKDNSLKKKKKGRETVLEVNCLLLYSGCSFFSFGKDKGTPFVDESNSACSKCTSKLSNKYVMHITYTTSSWHTWCVCKMCPMYHLFTQLEGDCTFSLTRNMERERGVGF